MLEPHPHKKLVLKIYHKSIHKGYLPKPTKEENSKCMSQNDATLKRDKFWSTSCIVKKVETSEKPLAIGINKNLSSYRYHSTLVVPKEQYYITPYIF
jgi:hypothetical protein